MPRGRPVRKLRLTTEERETLFGWTRRRKTSQALALRARVVLGCAEDRSNTAVAAALPVCDETVGNRNETFKLCRDPLFIEKVQDIVRFYLNPPERAAVLCVDEKAQIPALDRTPTLLTHKTSLIQPWLLKRPRYHVHFTPTGASRINLVER